MGTELTFSEALTNAITEVESAMPKNFNKMRYVANAVALLNDNENLLKFAKEYGTAQIKMNLLKGAYLDLDATQQDFYLIAYGKQLNFTLSYRGQVKICKRYSSRPIRDIQSFIVRQNDEYSEEYVNGKPSVVFKPKPFDNSPMIGVVAIATFEDGGILYERMSKEEVDMVRSKSKQSNSMPWRDFYFEMSRKACIRRLCKKIDVDMSYEQKKIFDNDMEIELDPAKQVQNKVSEEQATVEFIDAEATEVNA